MGQPHSPLLPVIKYIGNIADATDMTDMIVDPGLEIQNLECRTTLFVL